MVNWSDFRKWIKVITCQHIKKLIYSFKILKWIDEWKSEQIEERDSHFWSEYHNLFQQKLTSGCTPSVKSDHLFPGNNYTVSGQSWDQNVVAGLTKKVFANHHKFSHEDAQVCTLLLVPRLQKPETVVRMFCSMNRALKLKAI